MARQKKTTVEAPAWSEVEALVGKLGKMQAQRANSASAMDLELNAVRKRYTDKIAQYDDFISAYLELLEAAGGANRTEFGAKKSVEFITGTIGYRTGMPQLKTLPKWTWDRVKDKLETEKREEFLKRSVSIVKEAVLAARETLGEKGLSKLGCQVVQDETFYCDPKLETITE